MLAEMEVEPISAPFFLTLLLGGLCLAGVLFGIVMLVVILTRRQSRNGNDLSSLEAENERLREEIDRLKRRET